MKTFLKYRLTQRLGIVVFLLALTFSFSAAPGSSREAAAVLPACSSTTEYYSDATYTTQVGFKSILCNGQTVRGGTVTSFKISYIDGACSPQYVEICGG
jgi:hypothetical protein